MSLCIVSPHSREPGEARVVVGPWETQNSMLLSFYLLSGQVRLIIDQHQSSLSGKNTVYSPKLNYERLEDFVAI